MPQASQSDDPLSGDLHERLAGPPAGYFVVVPADAGAEEALDVRALLARLWRGRLWIIATTLATVGVAALHAFFATPIYRSEAVLVVRSEDFQGPLGMLGQLGGLASLAGIQLDGGRTSREEYLAYFKSRTLARRFIEDHKLLPVLFASKWDAQQKAFRGRAPTIGDAVDYFVDDVRRIRQDAKTGLVTLSLEWRDPVLAADWANKYVELGNETLRGRSLLRAKQSLAYLNEELARTSLEPVRQSIYRLMEGRINEIMFANVEPEFAFQIVDRAVAAEPRKSVRPRPLLEIALGLIAGIVLGGILASWLAPQSRTPA